MRTQSCLLLLTALILTVGRVALADEVKPEPGFKLLFNGKNLDGWKTKAGGKGKASEPLDGQTEAFKGRFRVVEGNLVLDPKVKGDVVIETARDLTGDVVVRFEFLPGPKCNNDLFFRGLKFDLKKPDVKNLKEGEWNTFEIVVKGGQAEFRANGETQRSGKAKNAASPLGIRAEFGSIQFRNLQVQEMP